MDDTMKRAAEAAGYELAYAVEAHGDHFFGLRIFVKMSERKLCPEDSFCAVANQIQRDLGTVSASLDPEGPAKRESYRAEVVEIYKAAGVEAVYVESLPNGYCSQPCCLNQPWFRVTSKIGHVVIGWRKRVLSIDWKDTLIEADGDALFPEEKTTRLETCIHAWGVVKAAEYIRRLHEGL